MRVVVGWVGSCNDAAIDELDDINLALETLVSSNEAEGGEFDLSVTVDKGVIHLTLGGLESAALRANLEASNDFHLSSDWPLDLNVFLGALLDRYEVVEREGDSFAVSMVKGI